MARTDKLQPMPQAAGDYYSQIEERRQSIRDMTSTCLKEGVKDHNRKMMQLLTPIIARRAGEIYTLCQEIINIPHKSGGRFPKWKTVAEEILFYAKDIIDQCGEEEIPAFIQLNQWASLRASYERVGRATSKIKTYLKQLPSRVETNGIETREDKFEGWEEEVDEILNGK